MALKAWWCGCGDSFGDEAILIFAETRGKAKAHAAAEVGCDFVEVRMDRCPKADRYADNPRAHLASMLRDEIYAYVECHTCAAEVTPVNMTAIGETVYCLDCAAKAGEEYPEGAFCMTHPRHLPLSMRDESAYLEY